jgi:hypothetical protein
MKGTEAELCTAGPGSPFSLERLSAFIGGDLSAADTQAVRRHVEGCVACARRAAELRAIALTARTLEVPEPPPTLWPAIEGALAREPRRWLPWPLAWRPFGVGALAGAVAAAVIAIGVVGYWPGRAARPGAPGIASGIVEERGAPASALVPPTTDPLLAEAEREFSAAAAVYERSIEKLRRLLDREAGAWPVETRVRYLERLARLDESIARSRETARKSPSDAVGNEQLFAAYQQKLAFLTETVHRGGGRKQGTP